VTRTQYFHTGFCLAGLRAAVHFELCTSKPCVPASLVYMPLLYIQHFSQLNVDDK